MPAATRCFCCEEEEPEVDLATQQESNHALCCGDSIYERTIVTFIEGALSKDLEGSQLVDHFRDRLEEFRAPHAQGTYCSNSNCHALHGGSRYLGAEGRALKCPSCHAMTCRLCKEVFHPDMVHICELAQGKSKPITEYIASLPEDERWLYQQCPSCSRWVEKSGACNHMTCLCSAQFCLVCGKSWKGLASCRFGCPKYAAPEYDADGYNQLGFHPDSGLDRFGAPWDPDHEHEVELPGLEPPQPYNADDWDGVEDWVREHENPIYDDDGFDQWGWNIGGLHRDGFTAWGLDADGFDRDGYDDDGFDRDGYGADGYDRAGYDREGFDAGGQPNMD